MDVRWETPPPAVQGRGGSTEELELATELRANPDEWARMRDFADDEQRKAGSLAALIRDGRRKAFRASRDVDGGEFEAVSRKDPDKPNITAVYVRFTTQLTD